MGDEGGMGGGVVWKGVGEIGGDVYDEWGVFEVGEGE